MTTTCDVLDLHPDAGDLAEQVHAGLSAEQKLLPCMMLYDEQGSVLFESICEQPEYYPTRTEIQILGERMEEIADRLGSGVQVIEPGSGAGVKTRMLLEGLSAPVGYVPIEISRAALTRSAETISSAFPSLEVQPVCADFHQPFDPPTPDRPVERRVVFFPGSTIGNFHRPEARELLERCAELAGPGGGLLVGIDRRKDEQTLVAAYDDAAGVTAAFNLNLLNCVNDVLGADFDTDRFAHRSLWNAERGRVEMHLVSQVDQTASVGGQAYAFEEGETIRTECSYKYGADGVAALAERFDLIETWTDADDRFNVQYFEVKAA